MRAVAADLPEAPDAVVVAVPAASVPEVIEQAGALGCGGAVVYAAGFREGGGAELEADLVAAAARHGLPVCGPNCDGLISLHDRAALWGDALAAPEPGHVALVSQSGNLAVNALGTRRGLRLHTAISSGNEAVLTTADYVEHLAGEDGVRSIALLVEGDGDGARLCEAFARCAEAGIGVAVLKVGASAAGAAAATAHTGALAGDHRVFRALAEEAGAAWAADVHDLLELAKALAARGPKPRRDGGLAILTCSGGDSGLGADEAARLRVDLPPLAPATVDALRARLPAAATVANPLDYTAMIWGEVDTLRDIVRLTGEDPGVGQVLVFYDRPPGIDGYAAESWDAVQEGILAGARESPVGTIVAATLPELLDDASAWAFACEGVPAVAGLRTGLACAAALATPPADPARLREIAKGSDPSRHPNEAASFHRAEGSDPWLAEHEAKARLRAAGVPVVPGRLAASEEDAVAALRELGGPVALKRSAPGLLHKAAAGALALDLATEDDVRARLAADRRPGTGGADGAARRGAARLGDPRGRRAGARGRPRRRPRRGARRRRRPAAAGHGGPRRAGAARPARRRTARRRRPRRRGPPRRRPPEGSRPDRVQPRHRPHRRRRRRRCDSQGARMNAIAQQLGEVGLPMPVAELARRRWDAVIVGGGHNGLTCATYLARAGQSVLVLERRERLGGACTLERPFADPRYVVSPCAYVVGLLDELVIRELGLKERGLRFDVADPNLWVPFEDGTSFGQWLDDARTEADLDRLGVSEKDKRGYWAYEHLFDEIRRRLRKGERDSWVGDSPSRAEIEELLRGEQTMIDIVFEASIADVLDDHVGDQRIKDALFGQGIIGTFAGPRDAGTASVKLMHFQGDLEGQGPVWGYVRGGMGMVSFAIADAAQEAGATLACGVPVAAIAPGEGVTLEDGTTIHARTVICNADPKVALRLLGDHDAVPAPYRDRLERWELHSPVVKFNAALTRLPDWTAAPGETFPARASVDVTTGLDDAQRDFERARAGEPAVGFGEIYVQTGYDPSPAPPGRHLMSVFGQYAPLRGATAGGTPAATRSPASSSTSSPASRPTSRTASSTTRCSPHRTSRSGSASPAATSSRAT